MTAAEIAAIYEPAFAAAGGRPEGWAPARYPDESGWSHWIRWGERRDDDDAANACRCWAQDYLIGKHGDCCMDKILDRTGRLVMWEVTVFHERDGVRWGCGTGPTVHHALAEAVIAVALGEH